MFIKELVEEFAASFRFKAEGRGFGLRAPVERFGERRLSKLFTGPSNLGDFGCRVFCSGLCFMTQSIGTRCPPACPRLSCLFCGVGGGACRGGGLEFGILFLAGYMLCGRD